MTKNDIPDLPGAGGRDSGTKQATHSLQVDISGMPVDQLLKLRSDIDLALPARSLKDLDLANELVIQVLALQQAQHKALQDDDTPTNQIAQAMNALTSAITSLVKLQNETYTAERLKKIELVLIEVLNTLPVEQQRAFLDAYEAALGGTD